MVTNQNELTEISPQEQLTPELDQKIWTPEEQAWYFLGNILGGAESLRWIVADYKTQPLIDQNGTIPDQVVTGNRMHELVEEASTACWLMKQLKQVSSQSLKDHSKPGDPSFLNYIRLLKKDLNGEGGESSDISLSSANDILSEITKPLSGPTDTTESESSSLIPEIELDQRVQMMRETRSTPQDPSEFSLYLSVLEKAKSGLMDPNSALDIVNWAIHDLTNSVTSLLFLDIYKKKAKVGPELELIAKRVHAVFIKMDKHLNVVLPDLLANKCPHDQIPSEDIHYSFAKDFSPELKKENIDVEIAPLDESLKTDIDYAEYMKTPLIDNLIQNMLKAYQLKKEGGGSNDENKVKISWKLVKDISQEGLPFGISLQDLPKNHSKGFFITVIEDNATGIIDPRLLQGGFQKGISGFKESQSQIVTGTGQGMTAHRTRMEHYGGTILIQNRTDIRGCRQLILYPLCDNQTSGTEA